MRLSIACINKQKRIFATRFRSANFHTHFCTARNILLLYYSSVVSYEVIGKYWWSRFVQIKPSLWRTRFNNKLQNRFTIAICGFFFFWKSYRRRVLRRTATRRRPRWRVRSRSRGAHAPDRCAWWCGRSTRSAWRTRTDAGETVACLGRQRVSRERRGHRTTTPASKGCCSAAAARSFCRQTWTAAALTHLLAYNDKPFHDHHTPSANTAAACNEVVKTFAIRVEISLVEQ